MFLSAHYAGEDLVLKLKPNEPWKKVFGPVFVYLNTLSDDQDTQWLWEDAKFQVSLADKLYLVKIEKEIKLTKFMALLYFLSSHIMAKKIPLTETPHIGLFR